MSFFVPFMFQEEDYHPISKAPRIACGPRRPSPYIIARNHRLNNKERICFTDNQPSLREVVDTRGFHPDDIKVEVSEDKKILKVTGKHEEKEDGLTVTRVLNKSFDLGEDFDADKLEKRFQPSGKLVLFAPKKKEEEKQKKNEDMEVEVASPINIIKKLFNNASGEDEIKETEDSFKVSLKAEGFKPEDLSVELSPDCKHLTIKGEHEEKTKNSHTSRKIHRSFVLPHNIKPDEIKSKFTKEGVLSICAPKDPSKKQLEVEQPKKLKITTSEE